MALPDPINHQEFLLTLDTSTLPVVKNALPGVDIWPLFMDAENGLWVIRAHFHPGITLPTHFHTGTVHFYTLSGCWYYLEYPDQKQTAGSYLYEPGGSIHTLHTPDTNEGVTDGFIIVSGCNINFDEDGNYMNTMDAGWIEQAILAAAEAQGMGTPRYIKPGGEAVYADDE